MNAPSQPSPATTRQRPSLRRRLTRIIGLIVAVVGFLSAGTGVLQYFGVTHLPLISSVIHPGADQILSQAKAASLKDVSCDISILPASGSTAGSGQGTGTCLFTSNPERTQLHLVLMGSSAGEETGIIDLANNIVYSKGSHDALWSRSSLACEAGQTCPQEFFTSLSFFYALSAVRFVGAEPING
jgi:hypothetical protein